MGMKQPTPQPHTPVTVQITTLEIAGMSCAGCARHITTALSALDGVIHVRVDLQKNEAIVEHLDGGEDENEVAEQFGLTLDDVRWARAYELSRRAPAAA